MAKLRRSRAGPGRDQLEAEYARVVNLMNVIEQHLLSQADRSERIARSLDHVAESLAGVPEASRRQLDHLSSISEALASEATRTKRIEESLSQWPQIADAQRETMVSIARQLDLSRESSDRVTTTMEQCRRTFTQVEEATVTSAKAVQQLASDSSTGNERIATLLEDQVGRFRIFAWSIIGLAGVAVAIALMALLR